MIKDPSEWTTALRYGLQPFGMDYSLSVWTKAFKYELRPFGVRGVDLASRERYRADDSQVSIGTNL